MAALTGWDPEVVGRASERCARLFGENMMFRSLFEGNLENGSRGHLEESFAVADTDEEGEMAEEDDTDTETTVAANSYEKQGTLRLVRTSEACSRCSKRKRRCEPSQPSSGREPTSFDPSLPQPCQYCSIRNKGATCSGITVKLEPFTSRSPTKPESRICPHASCKRHNLPFVKSYQLRRHLETVHAGERSALGSASHPSPQLNTPSPLLAASSPTSDNILEAAGPQAGNLTCPLESCPRHFRPFPRATNLYSHMRVMHEGEIDVDAFKMVRKVRLPGKSRSRSQSKTRSVNRSPDKTSTEEIRAGETGSNQRKEVTDDDDDGGNDRSDDGEGDVRKEVSSGDGE